MSLEAGDSKSGKGVRHADVQRQVTLSFDGADAKVPGIVRGISSLGASFLTQSRQTLPHQVTLAFGNGETFECSVDRDNEGTEFSLKFVDAGAFDKSEIAQCMDRVRDFGEKRSPAAIGDRLEELEFFGDDELLDLMEQCIDAYDQFVRICSDRLLPK